jgi:hypothetical protein
MKNKYYLSVLRLALIILFLAGAVSGCGSNAMKSIDETLTPMSASVLGTATARAENAGSGDTLKTAEAVATQKSQVIYATQTARASLNEPARLATITAMAPVIAELPRYGIDISAGYVAWMHDPVTISLTGYMTNDYANDYPQITAADFVMASDITWNTQSSLSGCGFMFRSNGDQHEPDQYTVLITRTAGGYMAFLATAKGNFANFHYYYPKEVDKSFSWFNDAKNRLAVVARGNLIDMYTNGHLIGEVDTTKPPQTISLNMPTVNLTSGATPAQQQEYDNMTAEYSQAINMINAQLAQAQSNFMKGRAVYTDGLLGFIAMNQSGTMTCKFENAWLFILNQ